MVATDSSTGVLLDLACTCAGQQQWKIYVLNALLREAVGESTCFPSTLKLSCKWVQQNIIQKEEAFNEYHMSPATEEIHNKLTSEGRDEV